MSKQKLVIGGQPSAGKSTFLALLDFISKFGIKNVSELVSDKSDLLDYNLKKFSGRIGIIDSIENLSREQIAQVFDAMLSNTPEYKKNLIDYISDAVLKNGINDEVVTKVKIGLKDYISKERTINSLLDAEFSVDFINNFYSIKNNAIKFIKNTLIESASNKLVEVSKRGDIGLIKKGSSKKLEGMLYMDLANLKIKPDYRESEYRLEITKAIQEILKSKSFENDFDKISKYLFDNDVVLNPQELAFYMNSIERLATYTIPGMIIKQIAPKLDKLDDYKLYIPLPLLSDSITPEKMAEVGAEMDYDQVINIIEALGNHVKLIAPFMKLCKKLIPSTISGEKGVELIVNYPISDKDKRNYLEERYKTDFMLYGEKYVDLKKLEATAVSPIQLTLSDGGKFEITEIGGSLTDKDITDLSDEDEKEEVKILDKGIYDKLSQQQKKKFVTKLMSKAVGRDFNKNGNLVWFVDGDSLGMPKVYSNDKETKVKLDFKKLSEIDSTLESLANESEASYNNYLKIKEIFKDKDVTKIINDNIFEEDFGKKYTRKLISGRGNNGIGVEIICDNNKALFDEFYCNFSVQVSRGLKSSQKPDEIMKFVSAYINSKGKKDNTEVLLDLMTKKINLDPKSEFLSVDAKSAIFSYIVSKLKKNEHDVERNPKDYELELSIKELLDRPLEEIRKNKVVDEFKIKDLMVTYSQIEFKEGAAKLVLNKILEVDIGKKIPVHELALTYLKSELASDYLKMRINNDTAETLLDIIFDPSEDKTKSSGINFWFVVNTIAKIGKIDDKKKVYDTLYSIVINKKDTIYNRFNALAVEKGTPEAINKYLNLMKNRMRIISMDIFSEKARKAGEMLYPLMHNEERYTLYNALESTISKETFEKDDTLVCNSLIEVMDAAKNVNYSIDHSLNISEDINFKAKDGNIFWNTGKVSVNAFDEALKAYTFFKTLYDFTQCGVNVKDMLESKLYKRSRLCSMEKQENERRIDFTDDVADLIADISSVA